MATQVLTFKGSPYKMSPDTLNQYVISMANRDTKIFENPSVFDPTRKDVQSHRVSGRSPLGVKSTP